MGDEHELNPEELEIVTLRFLDLNDGIHIGDTGFVTHFIERICSHSLYEQMISLGSSCTYPVTFASMCGNLDFLKMLISHNFDPNYVNMKEDRNADGYHAQFNNSPIHTACLHGRLHIVACLVEEYGVNIDTAKNTFYTPLYSAILGRHLNIVKYLVENGASLDLDNKRKIYKSPLHLAASLNDLDIVEYLLSQNMDVNCKDHSDQTALHHAVHNQVDTNIVKALLEAGADVNLAGFQNTKTPFMLATYSNNLAMVKLLYSYGADPLGGNYSPERPLNVAVVNNFYDIVRYLAIDLNLPLDEGVFEDRPLQLAVEWQHVDIINLLLKAGSCRRSVDLSFIYLQDKWKSIRPKQLRIISLYRASLKPRSLEDMCCLKIRKVLGRNLPKVVNSLPLPLLLINLVKMESIPIHK